MVSPREGLRARKRRARRQEIEGAALSMFSEQGFEATTVDQIVEVAGVSPRTFFHYFASKEDVVLGDFELRLARLAHALGTRLAHDPPSRAIRGALLEVAEDYESERERILQRVALMVLSPSVRARSLELQARWEDHLSDAFAAQFAAETELDPRPRILAAVTLGAMRIAQGRWLTDNGRERLPELITETLDLLDQGTASLDP